MWVVNNRGQVCGVVEYLVIRGMSWRGGWTELLEAELCNSSKHTGVCYVNFVICFLRKSVEDQLGGSCAVCRGDGKWILEFDWET